MDGQGANFLNWVQYGGPDTPGVLTWVFQAKDGSNNCHIPGYSSPGCTRGPDWGPGTGSLPTNVSSPNIAAGSGWHFIEILLQSSTTTTSQDGVVKIWIDGALSTSHTNVNISPGGFEDFQINPTWDGTKAYYSYPAEPLGRDCSRSWHHYFDHVRISSKTGS